MVKYFTRLGLRGKISDCFHMNGYDIKDKLIINASLTGRRRGVNPGMKNISIFIITIVVAAIVFSGLVSAQSPGVTYSIDINGVIGQIGLGGEDTIVNVGDVSKVTLTDPVVVKGSGLDVEEQGILRTVQAGGTDTDRVVADTATEFEGKALSSYDLIVLGGPTHNAYAKMLKEKGYLEYNTTDKKLPTVIFEVLTGPGGHKVVVIGDAAGYPYHKKDLPLNGILPEKLAPAAAVGTGLGVGLLGLIFAKITGMSGSIFEWLRNFIGGYAMTHVQEKASEVEAAATKVAVKKRKTLFLGISGVELLVALICIAIFGIAYVFADREAFTITNIAMYLIVAGVVTVGHDFGHKLVALKYKTDTEYKFWTLGTVTMILTSWLFGSVFAQPARAIIDTKDMKPSGVAFVALAGPAISLVLSLLFLLLIPFRFTPWGGFIAAIGVLGFSMNMLSTVYSLMPFEPMDGGKIYGWSKLLWGMLFIPLMIFYLVMLVFLL
jgi:Zn-dependent protease